MRMPIKQAKKVLRLHARNCRNFNPSSKAADAIDSILGYVDEFETSMSRALRISTFSQRSKNKH